MAKTIATCMVAMGYLVIAELKPVMKVLTEHTIKEEPSSEEGK